MRRLISLISITGLLIAGTAAIAEERRLTGDEIGAALADHTYRDADTSKKAEQIFQKQGVTYYSQNGQPSQGFWEVRGDQYCSQWPPNEAWSCYDVVLDPPVLTFISAGGARYPMVKLN